MDEEVILQSSPLYEHLQQVNQEEFDISVWDVTNPAVGGLPDVPPSEASTAEVNSCGLPPWCQRLLNIREAEDVAVDSLWRQLSASSCLSREHRSVLEAYQQAYHIKLSTSLQTQIAWMSLHSLGSALLWYKGTRVVKVLAAVTWLGYVLLPVATATMIRQLRATQSRISAMLRTFTEVKSVLMSIQRYCEEVHLIALGNGLHGMDGKAVRGGQAQELASSLRKAAILYLNSNIVKLREDLELLLPYINHTSLPHLELSQSASPSHDFTFNTFKRSCQHLRLLMSQWLFALTLLLLTSKNKSKIPGYVDALQGLTTAHHLQRQLTFCKAVLDGELSPPRSLKRLFRDEKDQAVHSLYLHARQLMNLAKMADSDCKLRTDDALQEMLSELNDCRSCLSVLSSSKVIAANARKFDVTLEETHEPSETTPFPSHTVIDQVFVCEGMEGEKGGEVSPTSEVCNIEMQLRREYEMALMRELRGVIHELARERIKRESALSQGVSREQVAQLTEELVTSRNIRALIQTQVDEEENNQTRLIHTDDSPDTESVSRKAKEYDRQPKKVELDDVPKQQDVSVEMKHLAEMVAARFALQQDSEETFGSDDDSCQ